MIKEIKYNGYTAQPSDYQNPDGDLALSVGMVPENGSLHPVMPPKVLTRWEHVSRVFVHKNNYTHYIVVQNSEDNILTFKWTDEKFGALSDSFLTLTNETVNDLTAVGNILVVASSEQMYYIVWKDGAYRFLANSIPDINIAFALQGEVKSHVYTDKNIEASTSSVTTAEEGWNTLATFAYNFRNVPGDDYSDYSYLDEDITLQANTNYAFSTQYSVDRASHYFCLEGLRSDTNAYELIIKAAPRATSNHYTLTPNVTYTKLRLRVKNRANSSQILGNTLIIEKGAASASVTLTDTIKNTSDNYTAMLSICNSFVNKYAVEKGKFIYPFFIRYAIKLYTGDYAHISSPILMVPNSGYAPLLHFTPRPEANNNINVTAYAFLCDMQLRLFSSIGSEWEDIIQCVDIFISQPIYPYNQGQTYDTSDNTLFTYKVFDSKAGVNELQGLDYGNLKLIFNGKPVDASYAHRDLYDILTKYYSFCDPAQATQWRVVEVAPNTATHIRNDIQDTSTYYLVHSLKFNDLLEASDDFADITLKDGALESLVNKKTLKDEMLANRTLRKGNLYTYNNRLHTFNTAFQLPVPKGMLLNNQYISTLEPTYDENGNIITISTGNPRCYHVFVFLRTSQGTKVVHLEDNTSLAYCFGLQGLSWFFYPDNNAYRALFVSYDQMDFIDIKLTSHDYLNGAYWLADTLNDAFTSVTGSDKYTLPTVDDILLTQSTIYVSEVNNPFTFLSSMAVSVGCRNVMALSCAAKPLSTGQFGKFPLYAFTDNGVWALEISSTGSYVARQPITRDVCINVNSICQLESTVLFATDRGIMELAGSSANCLTDLINTKFPFSIRELPKYDTILSQYNASIDGDNEKFFTEKNIALLPFRDFVKKCRIVNDYTNQRLILFNPDVRYAYVFSRLSSAWGMMQSDSCLNVNSYPEAQTIDEDGNLLDYGQTNASKVSALLVTRPFAMGEPDFFKTIDCIIQRGFVRKGKIKQILYASNDLFHWLPVASSTDEYLRGMSGTPYKYFRIVILGDIEHDESLYGCTVEYSRKLTDQPR